MSHSNVSSVHRLCRQLHNRHQQLFVARLLQVGMTRKSAAERRRAIAGDTQRQWRILRTWRSQFAPVVERLVHLQLR